MKYPYVLDMVEDNSRHRMISLLAILALYITLVFTVTGGTAVVNKNPEEIK